MGVSALQEDGGPECVATFEVEVDEEVTTLEPTAVPMDVEVEVREPVTVTS